MTKGEGTNQRQYLRMQERSKETIKGSFEHYVSMWRQGKMRIADQSGGNPPIADQQEPNATTNKGIVVALSK